MKKTMMNNFLMLFILFFATTSVAWSNSIVDGFVFGFQCFASEKATNESDFDNMTIDEFMDTIGNLNINDFQQSFKNLEGITIPVEKIEEDTEPLENSIFQNAKNAFLWITTQLWNIKVSLIILLGLFSAYQYIIIKKRKEV